MAKTIFPSRPEPAGRDRFRHPKPSFWRRGTCVIFGGLSQSQPYVVAESAWSTPRCRCSLLHTLLGRHGWKHWRLRRERWRRARRRNSPIHRIVPLRAPRNMAEEKPLVIFAVEHPPIRRPHCGATRRGRLVAHHTSNHPTGAIADQFEWGVGGASSCATNGEPYRIASWPT